MIHTRATRNVHSHLTSPGHRKTAAGPRPRASGVRPGGTLSEDATRVLSTPRKDEGGEADRGAYAAAAKKLYAFSVSFLY